jgi:hypothetical protein
MDLAQINNIYATVLHSDNIQDRVREKGNQDGETRQMKPAAGQLQDKQREGHGLTSLSDGEGGVVVPDGGAGVGGPEAGVAPARRAVLQEGRIPRVR